MESNIFNMQKPNRTSLNIFIKAIGNDLSTFLQIWIGEMPFQTLRTDAVRKLRA